MGHEPDCFVIVASIWNQPLDGPNSYIKPLSPLFTKWNNWGAWQKLACLPHRPSVFVESQPTPLVPPRAKHRLSRIESLPAELQSIIVNQEALSKTDLVSLALASYVLRLHVLDRVRRLSACWRPPWAGLQIGCLDITTALPDYPTTLTPPVWVPRDRRHIRDAEICPPPELEWSEIVDSKALSTGQQPAVLKDVKHDLVVVSSRLSDPYVRQRWALVNLTTRECVRCYREVQDTQIWVETDIRFPTVKTQGTVTNERLSIEDVLMIRFTHLFPKHRDWFRQLYKWDVPSWVGTWAGHRFNIIPLTDARIPSSGDKDVTDEVVEEAQLLFRGMYQKVERSKRLEARFRSLARGHWHENHNLEQTEPSLWRSSDL